MCSTIDPKSTAGILLREFSIERALRYAQRMSQSDGPMGPDYERAAQQIKEEIERNNEAAQ